MTQDNGGSASDLRHAWFVDQDGYMVSDWEVATLWDVFGRPLAWRRLCADRPEDTRVLSRILRAALADLLPASGHV